MAYPRAAYPLRKMTIWIGVDQWEWLQARRGSYAGAAKIIRDLVDQHRREIEEPEAPRWAEEALDLEGL
jgi:hypothetical protein